MARKIEYNDNATRVCEGSYKLILEDKIKGKFYMETNEGFVVLDNSRGKMRQGKCSTIEECENFFNVK